MAVSPNSNPRGRIQISKIEEQGVEHQCVLSSTTIDEEFLDIAFEEGGGDNEGGKDSIIGGDGINDGGGVNIIEASSNVVGHVRSGWITKVETIEIHFMLMVIMLVQFQSLEEGGSTIVI